MAEREILQDIIVNFSPDKFTRFFREKNRSFAPRQESFTHYNDEYFSDGIKLGGIKFSESEKVVVCAFKASQPLSERSGKKAQYEKGKKILKDTQSDAGIFIFYDKDGNFRFSLIYPKAIGNRRQWSNFRRFTYFVSPEFTNKTFLQRIGDGDFSSLEKIKDAFSVEKVTKEFYEDIANWYFWAVQHSSFPKDAEVEENGRNIAVIRLITRMIFIWFMREKSLVPKNLFEEKSISAMIKEISPERPTYYQAILQNLFFATLSTKKDERKFRSEIRGYKGYNPDFGNQNVFRFQELFKNPDDLKDYFGEIPFLNGGLFECLDDKPNGIYIDGFTAVKKNQSNVPNILFFSGEQKADLNAAYGTKSKTYKVRGLLDILSSFNFTIDENSPDDQDIALDPELLGRVFENLLASFNPETSTTARKATGSYYTPREIVDYMVTESLKAYFKTHLSAISDLDNKIEQLFSTGSEENPFDKSESKKLVELIESVRIVDPAVGSGAFPMGALNKLVFILNKVDPGNKLWKQAQLSAADTIPDPRIKQDTKNRIEEFFKGKNADYGRKLYLIQKCIYGVDIQQIAVEIAKLRFFISLLVDEKIDRAHPDGNWGIEPLPNLDFKIMQGNSLLEEYEGVKLFDERLLNATLEDNSEKLQNIEKQLSSINSKLLKFYQVKPEWMRNKSIERPSELAALESEQKRLTDNIIYEKNKGRINVKDVIHPSLFVGDKKSESIWKLLTSLHKDFFETAQKKNKDDLKKRIEGLEWELIEATFKEQNKISALKKLHQFKKSNTKPFFLWKLHFADVFEEKGGFDIVIANPPYGADIDENDLKVIKKNLSDTRNSNSAAAFSDYGKNRWINETGTLTYIVPKSLLYAERWSDLVTSLLGKVPFIVDVEKAFENVKLEQVVFLFGKTINTNSYIARKFLDKEFVRSTKIDNSFVSKYKAWICDVSDKELLLGEKLTQQKNEYLGNISETKRGVAMQKILKEKGDYPVIGGKNIFRYGVDGLKGYIAGKDFYKNKTKFEFLKQPKIISQRLVAHIQNPKPHMMIMATLDESGDILSVDTVENTVLKTNKYQYKYILALFNSNLISWFSYRFIFCSAIRTMDFDNYYVGKIPICDVKDEQQKKITSQVDKILAITKSNDYLENPAKKEEVKEYEKQIDQLIYKLYALTEEEIKIVEASN